MTGETFPCVRQAAAAPLKALPSGFIRGYASVFGSIDLAGDRVERGAFAGSLAKRGIGGIRMLWQHDPGRPIGVWTAIAEDAAGLLAEGRLALDTDGGREAFGLIRAGALDGLSIGFRTRCAVGDAGAKAGRDARPPAMPRRRLMEIDLWEISVVTFPMQERARVLEWRTADAGLAGRLRAGARRLAGAAAPASNTVPSSTITKKETTCPR